MEPLLQRLYDKDTFSITKILVDPIRGDRLIMRVVRSFPPTGDAHFLLNGDYLFMEFCHASFSNGGMDYYVCAPLNGSEV